MPILTILIPLSLALLGVALGLFFWAVQHDQFDDLDGPAARILDDDPPREPDRAEHRDDDNDADADV